MKFRRVISIAAGLAMAGGIAATAATAPAHAATPSCGPVNCINIYPRIYSGTTLNAPQFVMDVYKRSANIGQPLILFRASNSDPAEDFVLAAEGPASGFYAAGLLSSSLALHYGCSGTLAIPGGQIPCAPGAVDDQAYELEYAPYGAETGLCMGVATTAVSGTKVSLQPCGVSPKTTWLEDTNPGDHPVPPFYAGINGSGTNFSHPFVLTYPSSSYPTDKPRAQLFTTNLEGFSASTENDYQLFTGYPGILP